jgi:hypothetical protein
MVWAHLEKWRWKLQTRRSTLGQQTPPQKHGGVMTGDKNFLINYSHSMVLAFSAVLAFIQNT